MVPRSQDSHGLGHQGGAVSVLRPRHHRQHRGGDQRGPGQHQEWTTQCQVIEVLNYVQLSNFKFYSSSLLKPDFLLIRQDPRDAGEDFKSALLGFQYGQVPSINSLESVYNFQVSINNQRRKRCTSVLCKYFEGPSTKKFNIHIIPYYTNILIYSSRTSPGCMLIYWDYRKNLEKITFL